MPNEGGGGGLCLTLHCRQQNDSCVEVCSDDSHFNVAFSGEEQSHKVTCCIHCGGTKSQSDRVHEPRL